MANTYSMDETAGNVNGAWCLDHAALSITGDMTVEFWVKYTAAQIQQTNIPYRLFDKFYQGKSYNARMTFVGPFYWIYYITSPDGAAEVENKFAITTEDIVADTWYHYAIVSQMSQNPLFYINGSAHTHASDSLAAISSISDQASKFTIGGWPWNIAENHQGYIDDFRLWSVVRSASKISSNMSKELVGNETGLNGYWKLNNDYTDETSNGNDLTALDSTTFSEDVPFVGATAPTGNFLSLL